MAGVPFLLVVGFFCKSVCDFGLTVSQIEKIMLFCE